MLTLGLVEAPSKSDASIIVSALFVPVVVTLTVVMKFVGQELNMETIKSTIGIVLIFGMGYAALVAF